MSINILYQNMNNEQIINCTNFFHTSNIKNKYWVQEIDTNKEIIMDARNSSLQNKFYHFPKKIISVQSLIQNFNNLSECILSINYFNLIGLLQRKC